MSFGAGFSNPVDAMMAHDGGFYVLERGSAIRKIVYDPGPVVTLQATAFLEGPYVGGEMDTDVTDRRSSPAVSNRSQTRPTITRFWSTTPRWRFR